MDVDVVISKTKKEIEEGKNYLVLQPKKVIYIRDSYKTHKKYGKQVHNITDDKFMTSVKKIGVGKMLEGSLQNALRKLQIDKLKESDILRCLLMMPTRRRTPSELTNSPRREAVAFQRLRQTIMSTQRKRSSENYNLSIYKWDTTTTTHANMSMLPVLLTTTYRTRQTSCVSNSLSVRSEHLT
jgi:hypothetical protein